VREHLAQAVFVCIAATAYPGMRGRSQPLPFRLVANQLLYSPQQPVDALKVHDSLVRRSEDLAMLRRIFDHHAGAHGRKLKRPHRMTIAIGPAYKAQRNSRPRRGVTHSPRGSQSECRHPGPPITLPAPSIERHRESFADHCGYVCNPVPIGTASKEHIRRLSAHFNISPELFF